MNILNKEYDRTELDTKSPSAKRTMGSDDDNPNETEPAPKKTKGYDPDKLSDEEMEITKAPFDPQYWIDNYTDPLPDLVSKIGHPRTATVPAPSSSPGDLDKKFGTGSWVVRSELSEDLKWLKHGTFDDFVKSGASLDNQWWFARSLAYWRQSHKNHTLVDVEPESAGADLDDFKDMADRSSRLLFGL